MGWLEGTKGREKLHHFLLICAGSLVRRRCRMPGSTFGAMATTRLNRQVSSDWVTLYLFFVTVLVTLLVTWVAK